jgi:hypothetical protein
MAHKPQSRAIKAQKWKFSLKESKGQLSYMKAIFTNNIVWYLEKNKCGKRLKKCCQNRWNKSKMNIGRG